MKKITCYVLLLALLLVGLSACAPSPKEEAQAEMIRIQAQATQQAAEQAAELKQLEIRREAARTTAYEQGIAQAQAAVNDKVTQTVTILGWVLLVAIAIAIAGTLLAYLRFTHFAVTATQNFALLKASMVRMDPATGSFPVLVLGQHANNLNTGEVLTLNSPQQPAQARLNADAALRATAVLAAATTKIGGARRTDGDEGWRVADNLPLIGKETPYLLLGADPEEEKLPVQPGG